MSKRYFIENGQTISPVMGLDACGALISFLFYDAGGLPVAVSGLPSVSRSLYDSGNIFHGVYPFGTNEWRFNGPASRIKIDLTGVTGYTTYRVIIWRTADPLDMTPDGAFSGLRGIITQPYTEANVKNGLQFFTRAAWATANQIPASSTRRIWFKTTTKPVIIKLREIHYSGEEFQVNLYSAPTGVVGGTDMQIRNYNRVNGIASTCQAKQDVTVTTPGTLFEGPEWFFGSTGAANRSGTTIPVGRERIIPGNSEFLVEIITSSGTGNTRIQYFLDFYEGGTDLPIKAQ
jgi:hypothetical protein